MLRLLRLKMSAATWRVASLCVYLLVQRVPYTVCVVSTMDVMSGLNANYNCVFRLAPGEGVEGHMHLFL